MADYQSKHSGSNIDIGIEKALKWDPNIIGCVRLNSSMSAPLNLDTFKEPGSWIVDYYINGPTALLDYTPLPFMVAETRNGATLESVTQTVDVNLAKAYRTFNVQTNQWTAWMESGPQKAIRVDGTSDQIEINDPKVTVADMVEINLQLSNTLNANAKITVNTNGPFNLLMPDETGVPANTFKKESYIKVIFSTVKNAFFLIATPIPEGLNEKISALENSQDAQDAKIKKNEDDIAKINSHGIEGMASAVEHSESGTNGKPNVPYTKITFNEQGVVTKGENATGTDIAISEQDTRKISEIVSAVAYIDEETFPEVNPPKGEGVLCSNTTFAAQDLPI